MREASRRRDALAQQIASQYQVNPAVFWDEPPTAQERRDLVTRAGGSSRHAWPSPGEATGWSERFEKEGIPIDVHHTTVAATEGILEARLEHADPRLARQERLAALRSALPLLNPTLIAGWQSRAAAYPHELAVAMVRKRLRFRPAWEQERLAVRHEVLALYDSLCSAYKQLLLVLLGLGQLYFPGWRRLDRLLDQLPLAPPNLSLRLKQLFAIVSIDPLASVYQLHDIIEETFRLVETHLGEVDTHTARERFRRQRRAGEHAPGGLG